MISLTLFLYTIAFLEYSSRDNLSAAFVLGGTKYMIITIKDHSINKYQFNDKEISEAKKRVDFFPINAKGVNGLPRTKEIRYKNKLSGSLAEIAVYNSLKEIVGSLVFTKESTSLKNQIDLYVGSKTVEVRSSHVTSIEGAIIGKRKNGDSAYHLIGPYINKYGRKEIIRDYYIWVAFEDNLDHCYIVGGATKDILLVAPNITVVPKNIQCKYPTIFKGLRPDQIYNYEELLKVITLFANEESSAKNRSNCFNSFEELTNCI